MDTETHKNKTRMRIKHISSNTSENTSLGTKSDEDDIIAFTTRRIHIIDSDDEFSIESL